MNWRQVSSNPVSPKVHHYLLDQLKNLRKLDNKRNISRLEEFVKNKKVLDIGVVEHDISHIESERWKHKKIKDWSRKVVGIDILEHEVALLNNIGYDVRVADATSDIYLGEQFERIVVGDVVEHVSDPVNLLKFCARHLTDDGLIVISTPNPFYWLFILRVLKEKVFIANAEHVSWITPTMALELSIRADLKLCSYYSEIIPPRSLFKKLVKALFSPIVSHDCDIYAASYVYVFSLV